jgi:hypothetical protein
MVSQSFLALYWERCERRPAFGTPFRRYDMAMPLGDVESVSTSLEHISTRIYLTTLISGTRGVKNGVKGCPKRHLLHRVDHVTVSRFFLACAVKCHEFCSPPPHLPSLSPLLQAQNIASPKWVSTTYAPGLSKTAAYAAYCTDCFNYKYRPPSYFLLASSLL